MKLSTNLIVTGLVMAACLQASGPIGIYGVIEKVVMEPNDRAPERIQIWGAFAYVDGAGQGTTISPVKRGYFYFQAAPNATANTRKEWADLKAVAGTGQAVAFGQWGYIGGFGGLDPATHSKQPPFIFNAANPNRGEVADMRVRPASEAPANPAIYQTSTGVVKLSDQGSLAPIVKQLKEGLAR